MVEAKAPRANWPPSRRERAALAISRDGPHAGCLPLDKICSPLTTALNQCKNGHRQIKQTNAPCRIFPPSPAPPPAPKGTSLKWRAFSTAGLFPALWPPPPWRRRSKRCVRLGTLPPSPLPAGKASARPTSRRHRRGWRQRP